MRTAFDGRDRPDPDTSADGLGSSPEGLVCAALVASGRADGCGASVMFGAGDRLPLAATDQSFEAAAELEFSVWEGAGPEVVVSGHPVVVTDRWSEHARWPLTTPRARALPLRALAALPLTVDGHTMGLFTAYRRTPRRFTTIDLAALTVFAQAVATVALDRFQDITAVPATAISVAVGILMERDQLSADAALALLRARAYTTDTTVSALATAVIKGDTTING